MGIALQCEHTKFCGMSTLPLQERSRRCQLGTLVIWSTSQLAMRLSFSRRMIAVLPTIAWGVRLSRIPTMKIMGTKQYASSHSWWILYKNSFKNIDPTHNQFKLTRFQKVNFFVILTNNNSIAFFQQFPSNLSSCDDSRRKWFWRWYLSCQQSKFYHE